MNFYDDGLNQASKYKNDTNGINNKELDILTRGQDINQRA